MPKAQATQAIERLVPDTSVLIEGLVSHRMGRGELQVGELILHEASLSELEHRANQGRSVGFAGLDELKRLQELAKKGAFAIRFAGRRPKASEVQYASLGEVDALIRELAVEEGATLMTADHVQAYVAQAHGIQVILVHKEQTKAVRTIKLEEFFDPQTMSVHLREGVVPHAKKGRPGAWEFVKLRAEQATRDELKAIAHEIVAEARSRQDGFVEIEREGSTIVQLGPYRIVILNPPLSDGWEVTAVRPIKKLQLGDYQLSTKLHGRVAEKAEGILIAGAPGNGKTTFAQALAEHYLSRGKIVKTVEAPRDLMLPEDITQLAVSRGTPEEIHDILLLTRPDYTIFDEMRNTKDFELYADLRLSGVGMVGVIHGTNALDALQRFIGRIELGTIPSVVDTVIFIKNGGIGRVMSVEMQVKVPSGMTEADLARPVVVISDFESGKPEAEIYTYGEQTVIVPVQDEKPTRGMRALAAQAIEQALRRFSNDVKVELASDDKAIVYANEADIPMLIGREGKTIRMLEESLGISLEVKEHERESRGPDKPRGREIPFGVGGNNRRIEFTFDSSLTGEDVDVYVDGAFIASMEVGKKGISIQRENKLGRLLMRAVDGGQKVQFFAKA
jgi:ATPase